MLILAAAKATKTLGLVAFIKIRSLYLENHIDSSGLNSPSFFIIENSGSTLIIVKLPIGSVRNGVEVHSDFGIIGNLGLEYTFVKNETMTFSLLGLLGASSAFKVQTGYSFDVEGKLTYRYAKNLCLTSALGYAEFHKNTRNTAPTIESSQGRADLNLKLGLQKNILKIHGGLALSATYLFLI